MKRWRCSRSTTRVRDLVLYYKQLMVLEGNPEYEHHFNRSDALSSSQRAFLEDQWRTFRNWWDAWPGNEA